VDVTVTSSATRSAGACRVRQINEDQTGAAASATRNGTNSDSVLELLVDDNVMGRSPGEPVKVAGQVVLGESDRASRVNVQELGPVEDLHTVPGSFATDDNVVLVAADFAPDRLGGVLRQATEVDEGAVGCDLGKGSTVGLGDDDEFTAVGAGPSPRGGTLAGG
jgi:hypothetical protein